MKFPTLIPAVLMLSMPAMGQDPTPVATPAPDPTPAIQEVRTFKLKLSGTLLKADTEIRAQFARFVPLPVAQADKLGTIDGSNELEIVKDDAAHEARDQKERLDTRFRWRGALVQSGLFLAIQHGYRMTEEKTRRELKGPFFKDWKGSINNLHGWYDGGRLFTDYVAHPMQGAVTARIFINNSANARAVEYGWNTRYWKTRVKAFVWATAWSTQFEIGPLSEASLGNVGQKLYDRHKSKITYGDMVVTPAAGLAWTVGEDAMDKFVLRKWLERKIENRVIVKILRSVLTPTTSFANVLRGKAPWRRDRRRN